MIPLLWNTLGLTCLLHLCLKKFGDFLAHIKLTTKDRNPPIKSHLALKWLSVSKTACFLTGSQIPVLGVPPDTLENCWPLKINRYCKRAWFFISLGHWNNEWYKYWWSRSHIEIRHWFKRLSRVLRKLEPGGWIAKGAARQEQVESMYQVPLAAAILAMYDLGGQHHSQMYFSCESILWGRKAREAGERPLSQDEIDWNSAQVQSQRWKVWNTPTWFPEAYNTGISSDSHPYSY